MERSVIKPVSDTQTTETYRETLLAGLNIRKYHRFYLMCLIAVPCFACLTTLCCCVTCIMYHDVQQLKEELRLVSLQCGAIHTGDRSESKLQTNIQEVLLRKKRSSVLELKGCSCNPKFRCRCKRRKNKKKTSKSRHSKSSRRKERQENPLTARISLRSEIPPDVNGYITRAANIPVVAGHYILQQVDFGTNDPNGQNVVHCVAKWGGHVCTNDTFQVSGGLSLSFFKPAAWINTTGSIHLPFEQIQDGYFRVKRSGLYLLYLQVLFDDRAPLKALYIVLNSTTIFSCTESDDNVEYGPLAFLNVRRKDCNIVGIRWLQQNDLLQLKTSGDYNMAIQTTDHSTYFGAILMNAT